MIAVVNKTTTTDTIVTVGKTKPAFPARWCFRVTKTVRNNPIICLFMVAKNCWINLLTILIFLFNA